MIMTLLWFYAWGASFVLFLYFYDKNEQFMGSIAFLLWFFIAAYSSVPLADYFR